MLLAELKAISMAAGEASSRVLARVDFESDSLISISGIYDPSQAVFGPPGFVIEAIYDMVLSNPSWSFSMVSRQANVHADILAKWAAADRLLFGCIPFMNKGVVSREILEATQRVRWCTTTFASLRT